MRPLLLVAALALGGCADRSDRTMAEWEAHWTERAAAGDDEAAFELAFRRFRADDPAALAEFERLAEADHVGAIWMLALAYRDGRGVEADHDAAAAWLARAADLGDERAARDLAAYRAQAE